METIMVWINNIFDFEIFKLNQAPVRVEDIIKILVILVGFLIFSKIFTKYIFNKLLLKLKVDSGLHFTFTKIAHYIIMISGTAVALQTINLNLGGLVVIFGFLSVGIGFGLQNITSNFVSGLILLFERPIKIGDRVTVGDAEGHVTEINMRSTTIRSLNNISIIVPNSEFVSSRVINWSHGDLKVRLDVEVGVSYSSDLDLVIKALNEVAANSSHVLKEPKPEVIFKSFGDSSWDLQLRVWLKDPYDYYRIRSAINCDIVRKFRQYDIEIPFPQRDLHVRSPLPVPVFSSDSEPKN